MNILKQLMLTAIVGGSTLLMSSTASASQVFNFNGETEDHDTFNLILTTEDILTPTTHFDEHTNPLVPGLISPAYDFTGYKITGISGSWFEAEAPTTQLQIVALMDPGSIIENDLVNNKPTGSLDTKAHSPTDNLFNPNGGFVPSLGVPSLNTFNGIGGKFSYGGIEFDVQKKDGTLKQYQLFTNPDGGYAGCPGSCVQVKEVDSPGTLPLIGVGGLVFAWSRGIRRRIDVAKVTC